MEKGRTMNVKGRTIALVSVLVLAVMALVCCVQNTNSGAMGQNQDEATSDEPKTELKVSTGNAVVDSLVGNMVFVEGGSFMIGATAEQGSDASDNEKPAHEVTVGSFFISRYEVTQLEWETVMGSNPSYAVGDTLPVVYVNWDDCQSFISKLNSLTGLDFRLPTEAEWEYAARGGKKSHGYKYSGSDNVNDVAWYAVGSGMDVHAVGGKRPNELGLCDMSGNVYEWCEGLYKNYEGAPIDNPMTDSLRIDRVIRGGSCSDGCEYCRVSARTGLAHDFRSFDLGLRLAVSVPQK